MICHKKYQYNIDFWKKIDEIEVWKPREAFMIQLDHYCQNLRHDDGVD
jgi:hypothetical protein